MNVCLSLISNLPSIFTICLTELRGTFWLVRVCNKMSTKFSSLRRTDCNTETLSFRYLVTTQRLASVLSFIHFLFLHNLQFRSKNYLGTWTPLYSLCSAKPNQPRKVRWPWKLFKYLLIKHFLYINNQTFSYFLFSLINFYEILN